MRSRTVKLTLSTLFSLLLLMHLSAGALQAQMQFLKQSQTTQNVAFGPVVQSSDHISAITGLVTANALTVVTGASTTTFNITANPNLQAGQYLQFGAATTTVADRNAGTWVVSQSGGGPYTITVSPALPAQPVSGDTLTSSNLVILQSKNSGAFGTPVGNLIEAGRGWYAIVGNATDQNTLGTLIISWTVLGGTAGDQNESKAMVVGPDFLSATNFGLSALPTANPATSGGLITIGTGAGQLNPNGSGNLNAPTQVLSGTASAGGASTITLTGGSATTDLYKGNYVLITSGTGAGQARTIIGYNGGTNVATMSRAWVTNPDNTSVFTVIGNPHPAVDANLAVTVGTVNAGTAAPSGFINAGDKTGYSVSTISGGTVAPTGFFANIIDTPGVTTLLGRIPGTVQPQTGDSFARLGAPSGATIDADILSRLASGNVVVGSYAAGQDPATLVLDVAATSHNIALSIGAKINAAGSASDPLANTNATYSTPGTIGYDIATFITGNAFTRLGAPSGASIDADLLTRATPAQILTTPANLLATDSLGRVLLQPTQTGVTIPTVTTVGTLTTYTGNTPQSGDAYVRLGAPAGASVSADILTANGSLGTLTTRVPGVVQPQTGDSFARLGAPAGASVSADVATRQSAASAVILPATAPIGFLTSDTAFLTAIATNIQTTPVDGTLTVKQLQAINFALQTEVSRSWNASTHTAVDVWYRRIAGNTAPDLTKPIVTKTTVYDASNVQIVSSSIVFTNLP